MFFGRCIRGFYVREEPYPQPETLLHDDLIVRNLSADVRFQAIERIHRLVEKIL